MRAQRPSPALWLLFAGFVTAVVLLLYGGALALPFFFDDFVHYPFVEANSLARTWLTTDELAYYRPLNFSLWRFTYMAFERHNPVVDHAINLVVHGANGFIVGWLATWLWAWRGDRFPVVASSRPRVDWWRVYLSAALFLAFPFSYQAVPWVGSLSHILVTTLILLSLAFYVRMRRSDQALWGIPSLLMAFLAPFAHENGVLVMPLIVLLELTTPAAVRRWRKALKAALIWSLPLVVYLPIWLGLPRLEEGRLFGNSLEGVLQNSAYFLQGLFYPFTAFGGWLHTGRGVSDMTAVALLSVLGLVVALGVQLSSRASLRSLLPWLWYGVAALPAVLFLVFEYVINGPRLLMLASVGAAWLWADVALLFVRGARQGSRAHALRTAVAVAFAALLLWQNGRFIHERMAYHAMLGDGFQQVIAATTAANEAGEEAVFINFPSWLAPKRPTFALGHEGVLFWPDYVPPEMLMATHTGAFGELSFVRDDATRPELTDEFYGLTGPQPDWTALRTVPAQVLKTEYGPANLALRPVGAVGPPAQESPPGAASFRQDGGATGVDLLDAYATAVPGGVWVDLLWQTAEPPSQTTVFVHLVDGAGNLVAQADGDPLGGIYPFERWRTGEIVRDRRWVPLPESEGLSVRAGLYQRENGERLTAVAADGAPLPEDAFTLAIEPQP